MGADHLAAMLRETARRHARRPAITFERQCIDYGELNRRAGRVAQGLLDARVPAGRHIAILAKNHADFFAVWFGALKAGVVLLPVNFRLSTPEIVWLLRDAQAELLFVGPGFDGVAQTIAAELPALRQIVALGSPSPGWQAYADWIAPGPEFHDCNARAEDIALLIYTSGTTGQPKGAQLSHAALHADLKRYDTLDYWRDNDVMLSVMPLIHLGGIGFGLRAIYRAAHLLLLPAFDSTAVLRAMARFHVTKILVVPTMLRLLLDDPTCAHTDFSSLDTITYGAAPMPVTLLQRALPVFKCRFGSGYGLTESGGAVTWLAPDDHRGDSVTQLRSCGKPSGAEIRIVDKQGRTLPAGQTGEVIIRSAQVMRGYWNAPEANAETLRDGWLHSGDVGYFDDDGYLVICDRIKDMINSGGENIYPAEVEDALLAHPAVAEVAVIGIPDLRWGEVPKAIVVRRAGLSANEVQLADFLRGRIAGYKIPRSFEFVDALPRNAAGKVLKRSLRASYWSGLQKQVN